MTSKAGDDDIAYQIASFAPELISTFTNGDTTATAMTADVNGVTYEGYGINTAPKKVSGGLFMTSQDLTAAIFIPNAEIFSNPRKRGTTSLLISTARFPLSQTQQERTSMYCSRRPYSKVFLLSLITYQGRQANKDSPLPFLI